MSEPAGSSPPQRRPDRAALAVAPILAGIAALVVFDTSRLGGGGAYARIGPQTVPYAIAACLGLLAVWTVIAALRGDFPERERQEAAPVLWIVGGLVAQMALLNVVGFSIATGVLFAMTARGFARVNLPLALVTGIALSAFVWFMFARVLQLSLPAATLELWIAEAGNWLIGLAAAAVGSGWSLVGSDPVQAVQLAPGAILSAPFVPGRSLG